MVQVASQIALFFANLNNHELARRHKALAIRRRTEWFFVSRLSPYPLLVPFVGATELLLAKGMAGATGNFYFGLADFEEMSFLLHFLRKEDLFADIGANVGTYSILASGVVGACSVSVEPSTETLPSLYKNIQLNNLVAQIKVVEAAAGPCHELQHLTVGRGAMNRLTPDESGVAVTVRPLDDIFSDRCPALLKIDVEGAEDGVLAGAKRVLEAPITNAIVIEWPSANVHSLLTTYGFRAIKYDPWQRMLTIAPNNGSQNVIYVRDLERAQERVKMAAAFSVLGEVI